MRTPERGGTAQRGPAFRKPSGHVISLDYLAPKVLPGDGGRVFRNHMSWLLVGESSKENEMLFPEKVGLDVQGTIITSALGQQEIKPVGERGSGRHDLSVQLEAPSPQHPYRFGLARSRVPASFGAASPLPLHLQISVAAQVATRGSCCSGA